MDSLADFNIDRVDYSGLGDTESILLPASSDCSCYFKPGTVAARKWRTLDGSAQGLGRARLGGHI